MSKTGISKYYQGKVKQSKVLFCRVQWFSFIFDNCSIFCVVFYRSLFVLLFLFFWQFCFLFFDLLLYSSHLSTKVGIPTYPVSLTGYDILPLLEHYVLISVDFPSDSPLQFLIPTIISYIVS
jgi:hypothetical protein